MTINLLPGHPCRAVLRRPEDGMWPGPHSLKPCGKRDEDKPMCFRGEPWCCDLHRKKVEEQRGVPVTITRGSETIVGGVGIIEGVENGRVIMKSVEEHGGSEGDGRG